MFLLKEMNNDVTQTSQMMIAPFFSRRFKVELVPIMLVKEKVH